MRSARASDRSTDSVPGLRRRHVSVANTARRALRALPFPALVLVLMLLVVLPLGILLYATFIESPPRLGAFATDFTLDNYRDTLSDSSAAIKNSLYIGFGGTAIAMVVGCVLAWLAARTDVPYRPLIRLAGISPLFFSTLIGAIAWALIGSPAQGYANIFLRTLGAPGIVNIYSIAGISFVFGLYYAPYVFLFVHGALSLMDPELEEAAQVHGASRLSVLGHVTIKLVAPAILGAATLVLALVMENFPIPSILGTPSEIQTLPLRIYRLMTLTPSQPNRAATTGVVLLVIVAVMVYAQKRLLAGREYTTVTGKGFRPNRIALGKWRWAGFAFGMGYLLLSVVLPLVALAIAAFRPNPYIPDLWALFDTSQFNADSLRYALGLSAFRTGMVNTVLVAFGTALIGGALYLFLSYVVHRTKYRGRKYLSYIAMWPAAVPALVVGLGFLWTWIGFNLIYGTLSIIVLAFVARFMPQGYQGMTSTIVQVHQDMEDSALVSGAGKLKAVSLILLPLMRTGIVSTLLIVFILAVREFSIAIFLYTSSTQVVSITIFNQWEGGGFPPVAAMSLLYMLLLLGVAAVAGRWLRLQGE